eukprot:SAG31_NODE_910_length_11078_cov_25.691062_3_plen_1389_part_00
MAQVERNFDELTQTTALLTKDQHDHHQAITDLLELVATTVTQDDLDRRLDQHAQDTLASIQDGFAFAEQLRASLGQIDERVVQLEDKTAVLVNREMLAAETRDLAATIEAEGQQRKLDDEALQQHLQTSIDELSSSLDALSNVSKETKDSCNLVGDRVVVLEHAIPLHSEELRQLNQHRATIESKLDSTSQVLERSIELTADEMDRQLAQTMATVDTKLSKLQNEVRFQSEATEKTAQTEIRTVRSALDQAINNLATKVNAHESLLSSRTVEDIRDLRETMMTETSSIRETIDKRLYDTAQRVDQKLENSLKMVQDFTVSFRTEVTGVQEDMERMTIDVEKQTSGLSTKIADLRKDIEDHDRRVAFDKLKYELQGLQQRLDVESVAIKSASSELEKRVTNGAEMVARRFEGQVERMGSRLDATMLDYAQKHSVFEGTIADHHNYFSKFCDRIEQTVDDKHAEVNRQLLGLKNSIETKSSSLSSVCESLDKKLSDTCQQQEAQIENSRTFFANHCEKINNKVTDQSQKAQTMLQDHMTKSESQLTSTRTYIDSQVAQMKTFFSQRDSDFEEKQRTKVASQDAKIDSMAVALQTNEGRFTRMDASLVDLENRVRDNRDHFTKVNESFEKKLSDRADIADAFAAENRDNMSQHYSHFQILCADLEDRSKSLSAEQLQIGRDVEAYQSHFNEIYQKLDSAIKDDRRKFGDITSRLENRTTELRSDTDAKLKSHQQQFMDVTKNLDQKFMERHSLAETRIKDQHQLLKETQANAEVLSSTKDTEHDKRFNEMTALVIEKAQEAADMARKIEQQSADRDAWHTDKLTALTNDMQDTKRQTTSITAAVEKTVTTAAKAQAAEIYERIDALTQAATAVDRRIDKLESTALDRHAALQTTVDSNQDHVLTALTRNSSMHTERLDKVDQRLQQSMVDLQQAAAISSKNSAESVRKVNALVRDETAALQGALTKLTSTVSRIESEGNTSVARLEERMNESVRAIEDRATKQRDILTAAISRVDSARIEKSKSQDDVIETQHNVFTKLISDLDVRVGETANEQDEKTINLNRTVNEHYTHFTGVAERIIDSIVKEKEEQDRSLSQAFSTLEQVCAGLDQKLQDQDCMHSELIDQVSANLSSVEIRLQEKNVSQDERADALSDTLDNSNQKQNEWNTACHLKADALEQATDARIHLLEEALNNLVQNEVGILQASMQRDVSDLKGLLAEQKHSLSHEIAVVEEYAAKNRREHNLLDTRVVKAEGDLNKQAGEMSASNFNLQGLIKKVEDDAAIEARKLRLKLDSYAAEAADKLEELEHDVEDKMIDKIDDLDQKISDDLRACVRTDHITNFAMDIADIRKAVVQVGEELNEARDEFDAMLGDGKALVDIDGLLEDAVQGKS